MTRSTILVAAFLTFPLVVHGEEVGWFERIGDRAWLQNYDPTLLSSRVTSELSYEQEDGGISTIEFNTSLRAAIPLRDDLALGFQFGLPVKWKDDGTENLSGVGDFEFRTGLIGRMSPTLRWAVALNAKFDSAAETVLGDGVFQIRPTYALRWDASERVNLGFNLEYTVTPLDEIDGDLSYLELKLPVSLKLSDAWSASLTYVPRWNFKKSDDRHRLETAATLNWGADREFAWSTGAELPLSSQSFEWKVVSGFTWYFN